MNEENNKERKESKEGRNKEWREEKKEMLFWTTEEYKKFSEAVIDKPVSFYALLSGKLNDVPSGRLFRADLGFLQMCQSL